jgi:GntR family transcriptional repressor for pyruvate dehydrogenase complex
LASSHTFKPREAACAGRRDVSRADAALVERCPNLLDSSDNFLKAIDVPRTHLLANPLFEGVQRPARLADQVYQQLLEQIVEGALEIGQRLPSEAQLCDLFGVSRPVVRETISRLQANALVATRKGSGTVVLRRPDRAVLTLAPLGEITDLMRCFEFRIALEGEAAYLAAQRRTQHDLDAIEVALANLDQVSEREEVGVDADFRFHATISRATKNDFFIEQLDRLSGYVRNGMNLARRLSLARKRKRQLLVRNEHLEIARSIIKQDEDAARTTMRLHIDNARKRALDDSIEPS